MIDLYDDKLNAMAIAIGRSRGVKPRWIKLERSMFYDEIQRKWCRYESLKPSWDEFADEAKLILKNYEKQLAIGPILGTSDCTGDNHGSK